MRHDQYESYKGAAGAIELDRIRRLAGQLGWALKHSEPGYVEVWRREEAEPHLGEFVLSIDTGFADYEDAILRVVEQLADGEGIALPQMLAFLSPLTVTCTECRCDVQVSREVRKAISASTEKRGPSPLLAETPVAEV